MNGTRLNYRTASITASNYIGTGDDWLTDSYKNVHKIYNNLIDTTIIGTSRVWKEYLSTSVTISENIYTKVDTTSGYTDYIINGKNWGPVYRWKKGQTYDWEPRVVPPGERIRQMIQQRMVPAFHRRRTSLSIAMDIREERARQTLRRIIGEQAFKKFIRNGFITVVPKSGLTYRIYPGYGITEVYDRGIMVDRLCVVLQGDFPPTDSILMRYLLILNDEGEFSKYAIKHHVPQSGRKLVFPTQEEAQPLTEAWTALKLRVA